MSDGAPPVVAATTAADLSDKAPVEGAEAKPPVEEDELEALLKKKPVKYKAAGKEKTVTSSKDLARLLSRVDGTEAAQTDAARIKQANAEREAKVASLAKMSPRDRLAALKGMGIDPALVREAAEEEIIAEADRAASLSKLSPEERKFREERERFESERQQFERQQHEAREAQEQEAEVARITATGQRLEQVTVKALQLAKVSPDIAPMMLPRIAEVLDRNERLGLGLDEEELAIEVTKEHESMALGWLKGKSPADLHEALEASGLLKPLLLEARDRIRNKNASPFDRAPPAPTNGAPKPQGDDRASLIRAARTFGGPR